MDAAGSAASEALIETLIGRGWCFTDLDQVRALIVINSALADDGRSTADAIESELANTDLRGFGGKSLPGPHALRNLSHIQGPKVLQVSSARDISRSGVAEGSGSSGGRRLLKLGLTDGHTEITAVEYSRILSLPDDVVPGTKVRLGNKAMIHSGIVCLNPKVVTVIGGVVQTLFEEWEMNRKYAGFSRSSLKPSTDGEASGPPRFEKLQIEAPVSGLVSQSRFPYPDSTTRRAGTPTMETDGKTERRQLGRWHPDSKSGDATESTSRTGGKPELRQLGRSQNPVLQSGNPTESTSWRAGTSNVEIGGKSERRQLGKWQNPDLKSGDPSESTCRRADTTVENGGRSEHRQLGRGQNPDPRPGDSDNDWKRGSVVETIEDMPSSSGLRTKQVVEVESVPIHNQVASQKLLRKISHTDQTGQRFKGGRHRGKEIQEESSVITLDEWEKSRGRTKPSIVKNELPDSNCDEELAWKLQNQFDLEDLNGQNIPCETEAERLKRSMFRFDRDDNSIHGTGYQGRGRGRGQGRGRGRGSGKGRGRGRGRFD